MLCRVEGRNVNYKEIPTDYMVGGMKRYLEDGIQPGEFLYGLLTNDLSNTWSYADDNNRKHIGDWLLFLKYEVPCECHGSVSKVTQWMLDGGYTGKYNEGKQTSEMRR